MGSLVPKSGKAIIMPEKSNFARKHTLLSHFLKERGSSFGTICHGITSNPESNQGGEATARKPATTTLNLLPNMENSTRQNSLPSEFVGFGASSDPSPVEYHPTNMAAGFRSCSRNTAQMTIFYGGEVVVIDDFPAERAEAILALASKVRSNVTNGFTSPIERVHNSTFAPFTKVHQGLHADGSDLPIARKASLHRFLEKRKSRVESKAPYQISNSSSSSSPAALEEKYALSRDMGYCRLLNQLELKL